MKSNFSPIITCLKHKHLKKTMPRWNETPPTIILATPTYLLFNFRAWLMLKLPFGSSLLFLLPK